MLAVTDFKIKRKVLPERRAYNYRVRPQKVRAYVIDIQVAMAVISPTEVRERKLDVLLLNVEEKHNL